MTPSFFNFPSSIILSSCASADKSFNCSWECRACPSQIDSRVISLPPSCFIQIGYFPICYVGCSVCPYLQNWVFTIFTSGWTHGHSFLWEMRRNTWKKKKHRHLFKLRSHRLMGKMGTLADQWNFTLSYMYNCILCINSIEEITWLVGGDLLFEPHIGWHLNFQRQFYFQFKNLHSPPLNFNRDCTFPQLKIPFRFFPTFQIRLEIGV